MTNNAFKILAAILIFSLFAGCQPSKESIGKLLKENPKILTDAIEANPAEFVESFQKAIKNAQSALAKKRDEDEKKKLEDSFSNPLKPVITDDQIRGEKNAVLTLVEYSDFECPFCTKGYNTVTELMQKYGKKIRFVYKHLPLSFHRQAMISAQYFEAIKIQNTEKAYKFHDEIFENQSKLKSGEPFLKSIAKKVGANMAKLSKDLHSEKVMNIIKADQAEAAKFGMQGTPGFLLNGIPVKGAYPASHFDGIIEELKKRGKVAL